MLLAGDHHFMWLTHFFTSLDSHYYYVYSGLTTLVVLTLIGLYVTAKAKQVELAIVPQAKGSLFNIVEVGVESLKGLFEGIIGQGSNKHMPLLGALFIYIVTINLMGVIPGFSPATGDMSSNLAMASIIFLYFNYCGIRKHGPIGYLKHFMGPIWLLAPVIMTIELFGLFVRPMTLSLRLLGNVSGDHKVLEVFGELAPLGVPVIFMAFGVFVAFVQAFVFTLLSAVYVKLAEDEEH